MLANTRAAMKGEARGKSREQELFGDRKLEPEVTLRIRVGRPQATSGVDYSEGLASRPAPLGWAGLGCCDSQSVFLPRDRLFPYSSCLFPSALHSELKDEGVAHSFK